MMGNRIVNVNKMDDEMVELEVLDISNMVHYFKVFKKDWINYQNGDLIQNTFPYLSKDEREIIISGLTPEMWDNMFK